MPGQRNTGYVDIWRDLCATKIVKSVLIIMYYQGIFLDEKVDNLVKEVVRFVFTNKGSCGY